MRMSTMPGERLVLTWFFLPPYEGSNGVEREVRTPWMDACVLEWVREKKKMVTLEVPTQEWVREKKKRVTLEVPTQNFACW